MAQHAMLPSALLTLHACIVIKYRGIAHATRLIMKEEGGVFALYRGLIPTLMVRRLALCEPA